ncbi:transketolase C-terminal domain-containing protein [Streptomyces sp. NPDC044571]|uniref:transketolase-like TK C-terminal-containing protein n=1 Tax=Streptomyces sp. NPDC044571 TaxID=3155371 RepID=UPI0033E647A9
MSTAVISPTQTSPTSPRPFEWNDLDRRAVDTARALAVDAVGAAGHGHPAAAMSRTPAAHPLFRRLLRHDPGDPGWSNCDCSVLSCAHLVVLWDDDRISLGDDPRSAASEDVSAPFRAHGRHVRQVDWSATGRYEEDMAGLYEALSAAREETGRPSLVAPRTLIGRPWRAASPERAAVFRTHDSTGRGEDGPTHQPVEHLWALRGVPGLDVVRPADAAETAVAWRTVLERTDRPAGLCLSRRDLPVLDRSGAAGVESAEGTARGGYVLAEADGGAPQVVLIATGSEVHTALDARAVLQREGIAARVVSMPCPEWFREQSTAYREEVLPSGVRARVSVEAGSALGWYQLLGDPGIPVGLDRFGASTPYTSLHRRHGFTAERVAATARAALARAAHREAM